MAASPRVYAIVVNWAGGDANIDCIRSLLDQGLPSSAIIFVDNASHDDSVDRVKAAFPDITLLRNDRNMGYGHANNQGIEIALDASADFLFLVNNDILMESSSSPAPTTTPSQTLQFKLITSGSALTQAPTTT